jgi:hypothetical protein
MYNKNEIINDNLILDEEIYINSANIDVNEDNLFLLEFKNEI